MFVKYNSILLLVLLAFSALVTTTTTNHDHEHNYEHDYGHDHNSNHTTHTHTNYNTEELENTLDNISLLTEIQIYAKQLMDSTIPMTSCNIRHLATLINQLPEFLRVGEMEDIASFLNEVAESLDNDSEFSGCDCSVSNESDSSSDLIHVTSEDMERHEMTLETLYSSSLVHNICSDYYDVNNPFRFRSCGYASDASDASGSNSGSDNGNNCKSLYHEVWNLLHENTSTCENVSNGYFLNWYHSSLFDSSYTKVGILRSHQVLVNSICSHIKSKSSSSNDSSSVSSSDTDSGQSLGPSTGSNSGRKSLFNPLGHGF